MASAEVTLVRGLALLIPLFSWIILFIVKKNGRDHLSNQLVSNLPSDAPLDLHAFGLIASYPAIIVVGTSNLLVLAQIVGVLFALALAFGLTIHFWTTMVHTDPVAPKYRRTRAYYLVVGIASSAFGLLWVFSVIWGDFQGLI